MTSSVAVSLRRVLPIKRQVGAGANPRLRADVQLRVDHGRQRCVTARASDVRPAP